MKNATVVAFALTVIWITFTGSLMLEHLDAGGTTQLPLLAAGLSVVVAPLILLWLLTAVSIIRQELSDHQRETLEIQENIFLQLRLLQGAYKEVSQQQNLAEPEGINETDPDGKLSEILVTESQQVGPEFIHQQTEFSGNWIELEFRNVGGPAKNVLAITEGDTDTRVSPHSQVDSWKTVKVGLQPISGAEHTFRFCLNFDSDGGLERQQFFQYSKDGVKAISRPMAD